MKDIYIVPCQNYEENTVATAMQALLINSGLLDFVKPKMKIIIKVNLVGAFKPQAAATTHPNLLCELTRLLIEKGAEVIIGDSPGGLYNASFLTSVYSVCGLKKVTEFGAKLNENFDKSTATFEDGKVLNNFEYTSFLDNCDAIINFCKLKTHGMMGMSAAVKNMFGAIPGTFKPEYHMRFPKHAAFANMLIDLNEYFKPALSIIDAVDGMEGNGPTAGSVRHIGALLASRSPYKLDIACAKIINIPIEKVPTITSSIERGLTPANIENISVEGNIKNFIVSDFKLVENNKDIRFRGKGNIVSKFLGFAARTVLKCRPELHFEECIGCGKCKEVCPANAIKIVDKKAIINRKNCIRCFCCQEFCPKGAMKVHRPLLARLINR